MLGSEKSVMAATLAMTEKKSIRGSDNASHVMHEIFPPDA
jgi:hypothetical protein